MPAVSETALVHAHDDRLTVTARVLPPSPDRAEREAAAIELREAFCAELKHARERRGISLEEISHATKIARALFADLERCDLSRWPTGLYRRAFFREYAALVGLPGESTVSEFVRLFPDELERGSVPDALVPGPLRLTLARPAWQQLSPLQLLSAGLDLAAVAVGAGLLTMLAGLGAWTALGAVAVAYHTLGIAMLGCSPASRWLRSRPSRRRSAHRWTVLAIVGALLYPGAAAAQERPFQPEVGQPGKDVVWVPTPEAMVERMLDLAAVTPKDFVMDLGSGDGRNVIGAARRGASALGVEYNPDMVSLSKRLAQEAGVADKAQFVQGDMFLADISKADVLALFLLPSNLLRLRDKFLALRPGARIVSNTFSIQDWEADETVVLENCDQWCTALLYIVPAKIDGTWRMGPDVLEIKQEYQMLSGTLTSNGQAAQVFGFMRGTDLNLKVGGRTITGRVQGDRIDGTIRDGDATSAFRATRATN
jgi:hypothetical protein